MNGVAGTFAERSAGRPNRSLFVAAAAFFFLVAQALFAAHASSPVDDLQGHSPAECAVCLAGAAADDPANGAPQLAVPESRFEAAKTAIPAALLTEISVRAAAPRAPPID
jgi:hypothetical protein